MSLSRRDRRNNLRKFRAVHSVCLAEMLERRLFFSNTFLVTTLADPGTGSLRQAIMNANTAGGTDIIDFASGLTGTINLGSALPNISSDTTIIGPGANVLTVNGHGHGAVFHISSGFTAEIEGLTITGGAGTFSFGQTNGGGISNFGNLTVANSTISGNAVSGAFATGGGIYTVDGGNSLTVTDCTISGNSSTSYAGGIGINYGSLTVTNSTITGNSATVLGGGVYGRGIMTITDSTITGNSSGTTGGLLVGSGVDGPFSCTLDGSIVAGNTGGDFGNQGSGTVSGSNDLIGDGSDNGVFTNSLRGTSGDPLNPLLGPLANNGGPTETEALLTGSPAVGTGASFDGITTDQRGDPRPSGPGVDMGAFQLSTLIVNTLTDPATPTGGILSLREAISDAISMGGSQEITFISGLTGTINLASVLPAISSSISIVGPGANLLTVNGNSHGSVFSINQGVTAEIEGLSITGGSGTTLNGFTYGGGVFDRGNLTITDSTISGNTASGGGGGIYSNEFAGSLTVNDSTISGNTASIFGGGINQNYGTLTVSDSTITSNIAPTGGGFFGRGVESFIDSTISGNIGESTGGVYVDFGTLGTHTCTVDGTIIAANLGGDFANTSGFTATGSNDLIGDGSDAGVFTSSLRGTPANPLKPLLGSLAFNGGPTETMALQTGSPAVGTGAGFDGITADQRGELRPSGTGIDIGAFQIPTLVVNTLTDPAAPSPGILSLREAINDADLLGGTQEITFAPGLTGSIVVASVLPAITTNLTIDGPGAGVLTVNGNNLGSVFTITPAVTAEINDLTITGGGITDNGSLITEGNLVTGAINGSGGLTLGEGVAARLKLSTGAGDSTVTSVILNTNATLDITNNSLNINYGSNADPIASVAAALGSGYAGGAWTGIGIVSSTAAAGGPHEVLSVGYDDGKTDNGPAGPNQILVKYTLAGDANLDEHVNSADLLAVVQNFNKTGTDWVHGNYTYIPAGQSTTSADLLLVVQNFNVTPTPAASAGQQLGGTILSLGQSAATPAKKKPAPAVSSNNYLPDPAPEQPASANAADDSILQSNSDDGSILTG